MPRFPRSVLLLVLAACSGAAPTDLFGEDPRPAPSDDADGAPAAPAPTGSGTAPAPPAPTGKPPPPEEPPPPLPGEDGGIACDLESEPNDALGQADPFATSFCGKLAKQSDVDVAKVKAPAGTSTMTFTHEQGANVHYRIYQDGAIYAPIANDTAVYPVLAGSTYAFRMSLPQGSGQTPAYKIDVVFQ